MTYQGEGSLNHLAAEATAVAAGLDEASRLGTLPEIRRAMQELAARLSLAVYDCCPTSFPGDQKALK